MDAFSAALPFVLAAEVPIYAESLFEDVPWLAWLTNSIFVALLVVLILVTAVRAATKRLRLVPAGIQNVVEFVVEFLYGQVEQILGPKLAPRCFPLLATLFVFILVANWFGLVPGVGTIGLAAREHHIGFFGVEELDVPLLRPATADANLTFAMALSFMVIWFGITIREVGFGGFLKHLFGPKGGMTGLMGVFLGIIFFLVGIIELISIMFRPVSLAFRLLGNIFAGETLLHVMGALGDALGPVGGFLSSVVLPLPFYFLEILVGLVQALVFTLLCAVYIQLSTAHEEEEH
ncbi:MAG TPA: F0F1 ATP synthase subunit A [Verrucomicrobiales bacterium]|nr:F0F1 ATP synthase subunit A [Verrucomicrobiales bacterium]